jgi:hypothetical protein
MVLDRAKKPPDQKNLERFQRLLAESDQTKDRERHNMLLRLLAEKEAKDKNKPLDS